MSREVVETPEDAKELCIQINLTNWQCSSNALAPLSDNQLDIIYEINDLMASALINKENEDTSNIINTVPCIHSYCSYIKWMASVEEVIKHENLKEFEKYNNILFYHSTNCQQLFDCSITTINQLQSLKEKYQAVTSKTNYLHDLSEQLMAHQRILKDKRNSLTDILKYFSSFNKTQENVERLGHKINTKEFLDNLDHIDNCIDYLNEHMHFKESRIHKMKYESLLNTALNKIYNYVHGVITETTKQVIDPELKAQVVPLNTNDSIDSAFALYYGKFQSASSKVKQVLQHLEKKEDKSELYMNIISDCQKSYLIQRLPILGIAVSKALVALKEKYKTDYSILFRSCSLFTMKVCQDEARCYSYFFTNSSEPLNEYLATLCQHLYDTLRPSLISINHVEVLSELCGILKREMLSDKIVNNEQLVKYEETIRQLLQDVEERLVFRTNVFLEHDLLNYKPSHGDLAYPDKLEQMENIALELSSVRNDSRSSVVSLDSQEVAQINSAQMAHFRSYTGNSPADLHGMWYPTVKRTLVCLSRLYFCLDKDTFQGLAQEALVICIKTVQHASDLISTSKTPVDGRLFQIKHLLIIREQIAPFQVDFTVKELTLDFSTVHKAAMELIQNRNNLFTFGSNNALLEFLLEGTPKVKEYLIDSRKEIDKELKHSCETFISHVTQSLIGSLLQWIQKADHIIKIGKAHNSTDLKVSDQEFGKTQAVAQIIKDTNKNMKAKIPEIQRSMQLYLANRETEFILFRPIKNNIINAFMQVDNIILTSGYTADDQLLIGCPSPELVNILICSVSLSAEENAIIIA